jgi:hypothetical protein
MTYHLEIVSLEIALKNSAIVMSEDPLTVHFTISEVAFILMTLYPFINTRSIVYVSLKTAAKEIPVIEYCAALAVLHVSLPTSFVFCDNAVFVSFSTV